jgi:hypothetical protein
MASAEPLVGSFRGLPRVAAPSPDVEVVLLPPVRQRSPWRTAMASFFLILTAAISLMGWILCLYIMRVSFLFVLRSRILSSPPFLGRVDVPVERVRCTSYETLTPCPGVQSRLIAAGADKEAIILLQIPELSVVHAGCSATSRRAHLALHFCLTQPSLSSHYYLVY